MLLRRVQPGLLRAGMRRDIGWLRCGEVDNKKVSVHVEP
jgi:predicted nuclease of predicted toxin-antitoxin system